MKNQQKIEAIKLRKDGHSIREISEKLVISKSTASVWARNIDVSDVGKIRISRLSAQGRLKAVDTNKQKREKIKDDILQKISKELGNLNFTKVTKKIFCSLLYWCEGEKSKNSVNFTNSDPKLMSTFLNLFRKSFDLDESRFRVCLHLHGYHNELKQKTFWSDVTGIPKSQFIKTCKKQNSGITIKKDYPGCASVRYNDVRVAIEMEKVYSIFANII